jgi:hypothetical protein
VLDRWHFRAFRKSVDTLMDFQSEDLPLI